MLWLRFIALNEKTNEVPAELLVIPEIKEAVHLLESSAYTLAELDHYDKYWHSVSCEKTLLNERNAQASAQGISQEKRETARRMKAKEFLSKDITEIAGLSLEEINNI